MLYHFKRLLNVYMSSYLVLVQPSHYYIDILYRYLAHSGTLWLIEMTNGKTFVINL